jgi:hypothetical protein
MSSPILPVQGPSSPVIASPTEADPGTPASDGVAGGASTAAGPHASTGIGDVGAFIAQLAAGVSALSIEAGRNPGRADRVVDAVGGPPPEVLDQIAVAGRIGEQLREAGHELRFFAPSAGGRVRIEIHDRDGNALGTLSPAAALALAAGSPLN